MNKLLLLLLLLELPAAVARAQALNFSVMDGATGGAVLTVGARQTAQTNDNIRVQQTLETAAAEKDGRPQIWKTTITNTGSQSRRLYLNWSVAWDGPDDAKRLHYWNGSKEPVGGEALSSAPVANANQCTTMLQTIYDDKNGLALALNPFEIAPVFEQSLENRDQKRQLRLQIPLVLAAGQSDTFPVEIYRFTPRYGFLDALQRYYNAHPEAFAARTDIDLRGAGVGAAYTAWNGNSSERTRRFGGDWDWCYAPFKRTGDIYGREPFWNYASARPIPDWEAGLSPAAFRANRRERFDKGAAAGAAMMFYVPSFIYCEESLAKTRYPGAIVYKPDGKYAVYFDRPWVTGHDNEVLIYPWGNEYSAQSMADARDVMRENPISGFAYDTLNGGYPFRGAGMKESPRHAFNADGEYVDLSVGVAKMMDFTRSLQKDGRKMALVGNPTGNTRAFLVARCDSAMYERPPYKRLEELIPLRYAMGHKPLTWWDDWGISSMLNWREMSPAAIRDAYRGVADYVRLISYRYGGYPSPRLVEGVPSVARELPLLKEVVWQGWQAVPAVRAAQGVLPAHIWPARYGKGIGSFIAIGNAERTAWSGRIAIDDDYLGEANYLFADTAGKPLAQTVQGRTTLIEVQVPAHETLVLRAVAAASATASGAATVAWNDDGASGDLQIRSTLPVTATRAPRDGWKEAKRDGAKWSFVSRHFASPIVEIRRFPFFGGARNAVIVLPAQPAAEEEWAAQRIREYFQFWGDKGLQPARKIDMEIVRGTTESATPDAAPRIVIGEGKTIRRAGDTLFIGGDSLREATLQLLAALDEKYFYCGVFPRGGEQDGEAGMIQKAGLGGKLLTSSEK